MCSTCSAAVGGGPPRPEILAAFDAAHAVVATHRDAALFGMTDGQVWEAVESREALVRCLDAFDVALVGEVDGRVQSLGLLGSRFAVILPLIGLLMPFGVFWMRAHFTGAETAPTEAARLDGASNWQIFRSVHLPLARPAVAALTILFFLATWNQYLLPLVLIDDPSKRTVAGGLGAFQTQYGTDTALLCEGSLIIIAPSLAIFLIFQRSFVKALLEGALK